MTDPRPIKLHGLQELLSLPRVICVVSHTKQCGLSFDKTFSEFLAIKSKGPAALQYSTSLRNREYLLTTGKTLTSRQNARCDPFASAHPVRRFSRYCC